MIRTITICCLITYAAFANAQLDTLPGFKFTTTVVKADDIFERYEEYYYSRGKEIGLDFTSLLDRFIPFNFIQQNSALAGIKFKKYGKSIGFRLAFGGNLDSFGDNPFLYFSVGYEKRRQIHNRWTYTRGWELYGFGDSRNDRDENGLGISRFYGIEYNINDKMFVSTEAALQLGIQDGFPDINFNIPTTLFFNIRF